MNFGGHGNLTRKPDVTTSEAGAIRVRFVVASTERYRDQKGVFQDATTVFTKAEWWGARAGAFAEAAEQGTAVVMVGTWRRSEWTTDEGEKRNRQFVVADAVGIVARPPRAVSADTETQPAEGEHVEADQGAKNTNTSTAPEGAKEAATGETNDFWDAQ